MRTLSIMLFVLTVAAVGASSSGSAVTGPSPACSTAMQRLALALAVETSVETPSEEVRVALGEAFRACGPGWLSHHEPGIDTKCSLGTHRGGGNYTTTISVYGVTHSYVGTGPTTTEIRENGASTYEIRGPAGGMRAYAGGGTIYLGNSEFIADTGSLYIMCQLNGNPCWMEARAEYDGWFEAVSRSSYSACPWETW